MEFTTLAPPKFDQTRVTLRKYGVTIKPCEPLLNGCIIYVEELQEMIVRDYANRGQPFTEKVNPMRNCDINMLKEVENN